MSKQAVITMSDWAQLERQRIAKLGQELGYDYENIESPKSNLMQSENEPNLIKEVPRVIQQKFINEFESEVDNLNFDFGIARIATKQDVIEYEESEWQAFFNLQKNKDISKAAYNKLKREFSNRYNKLSIGDILRPHKTIEIPQTAKERYELLKKFSAKYFFYHYKVHYLNKILADNDTNAIKAEIQELDKIKKHEQLSDTDKRNKLYPDAVEYIHHRKNYNQFSFTYEQIELFIYILHENNFFSRFLLPDEEFYNNRMNQPIADSYGKYFLFYDYLTNKLKDLQPIDFVVGEIDEKEPLKYTNRHLLNFITITSLIERDNYVLTNRTFNLINRLLELEQMAELTQGNIEMKQYFLQNGTGIERAIKYLNTEFERVDESFNRIAENNLIIKKYLSLGDKQKQVYFDSIDTPAQEQFKGFFDAQNIFLEFYTSFLTITGLNHEAQIKAKQIEYNIDNLKEIFYPKAIEIFVEIEKGFIGNGWIKNNAWVKEKNMLVSIILILENRGYFRKIRGKSKSTFMLKCRQFFESRYNINISKQMQPNQRKKNRLPESYEPSFQSISVIE